MPKEKSEHKDGDAREHESGHSNISLDGIRHSLAHLLAAAVRELYPGAKNAIGPAIENGFYQDCELPEPITEADFPRIEKKMREILKTWTDSTKRVVTPEEARKEFAWNEYKLELIDELAAQGKEITFYTLGDFVDLCKGGHAEHPATEVDPTAFKLDKVAGAYWRGDANNKQLTRIYGLAFKNKEELVAYEKMREEAKKRDHRKLGKDLGLFSLIEEIGPGLPLFYPKGAILRRMLENYITEMQEKRGYLPIWIPHITKGELYKISGHLEKYDAMYPPMDLKDEANYYLKPMNCPHFMMLYKTEPHSYRELPLRWTCTTTNYRYEKSGELSGLTRVRSITQDDCHVFARADQIEQEINIMLDMIGEVYKTFGFDDFRVRISVRDPHHPEHYIGDEKIWHDAEGTLKQLIETRNWKHEIGEGEAAFYGPKLDFIFKDVLGRDWQLSTIQLDMNLPKRFKLEYIDDKGEAIEPIVIHRAILGSTERFMGILIEHFAGAFPVWLAPAQVTVVPVSEKFDAYGRKVFDELMAAGIRAEFSEATESLGKRIRQSEMMKIPYVLVIGEKEEAAGTVAVRGRGKAGEKEGDEGAVSLETFLKKISRETKERTL